MLVKLSQISQNIIFSKWLLPNLQSLCCKELPEWQDVKPKTSTVSFLQIYKMADSHWNKIRSILDRICGINAPMASYGLVMVICGTL